MKLKKWSMLMTHRYQKSACESQQWWQSQIFR